MVRQLEKRFSTELLGWF